MTPSSTDPHNLARFIAAQEPTVGRVRTELRAGRKASHWMWFVFPQIAGLGRSDTARFYAIQSRDEAVAYLAHSVLGPRLVECTQLVNAVKGSTAEQILGHVDAMKFHSCMTLFATVDAGQPDFAEAVRRYCGGALDQATLDRIQPGPGPAGRQLT